MVCSALMNNDSFPMRINKYIAHQGIATRTEADKLIERGLVYINGTKAVLGDKVLATDTVEVRATQKKTYVYMAYYKPKGIVTHSPKPGETSINDTIAMPDVFPVGRLDKNSHGLLILTNDGRVTDRLLNPRTEHEKEYIVRTKEKLRTSFKEKMEQGVNIEGYVTKPCRITIRGDREFSIILTEGKRHQIKRMVVALFNEVTDLKRIRIMNVTLSGLQPGDMRQLDGTELATFLDTLGLL